MKFTNFKVYLIVLALLISLLSPRIYKKKFKKFNKVKRMRMRVNRDVCGGGPTQQSDIEMRQNACGPEIIPSGIVDIFGKVLPNGFDECCNVHDICYNQCNPTVEHYNECDDDFDFCLQSACDDKNWYKRIPCRAAGKALYKLVSSFDFAFWTAQNEYCECI